MKDRRRAAWGAGIAALALLLGTAGCGKSLRSDSGPGNIHRVTVAPTTDGTVKAGETKKFVAVAAATSGHPVTTDFSWSLDPPSLGTVVGQGSEALVTGKTPGTGKLIATSANGIRGETIVTVVVGPIADIRVEAVNGRVAIEAGDTETFRATGVDLGGNIVGQSRARVVLSPKWSVTGGIGTIDSAGVFTAAGAGIGKTGQVVAEVEGVTGALNIRVVQGSRATYVGADTCKTCHGEIHNDEMATRHAGALGTLKRIGMGNNPECLGCHTVGYGRGGYVSEADTPGLTNVQCESCHGPGSQHVAGGGDKTKIVTGADVQRGAICGTCHTDAHHPTVDEWEQSVHAEGEARKYLVEHEYFAQAARIKTCGACHVAAGRLALLKGKGDPDRAAAEANGITCAVCHDPHRKTPHGSQLRSAKSSLQFFTYDYNKPFESQYNENILICAQCHNTRNATVASSTRPPHHSPQYNMLIGDMGPVEAVGIPPAPASAQSAHRNIDKQCIHCHMFRKSVPSPTEENPNNTGHRFRVDLRSCAPCHSEADAGARVAATQQNIRQLLEGLRAHLSKWVPQDAENAKYVATNTQWEYSSIRGGSGAAETAAQQLIPAGVKQARFNYYLVLYDRSYGVHNAKYARWLIDQGHAALDSEGIPR